MKRRNTFRAALALLLILTLCMPAAASGFNGKLIAITFDDGPGAYTAQLLDELAARDVKATFFVSGYRAANYPETLKRMVSEGHQLASHTQNHENLNTLSAAKIADEISRTQDYITAAGGDNPAYIRPPYGNANKTVRAQAPSPLINWSVDPEDWKYHNADTVCKNILAGSYDGAIILVHDIYQTSVNGALAAIDKLLEQGYEFVTVRDLLLRRFFGSFFCRVLRFGSGQSGRLGVLFGIVQDLGNLLDGLRGFFDGVHGLRRIAAGGEAQSQQKRQQQGSDSSCHGHSSIRVRLILS